MGEVVEEVIKRTRQPVDLWLDPGDLGFSLPPHPWNVYSACFPAPRVCPKITALKEGLDVKIIHVPELC